MADSTFGHRSLKFSGIPAVEVKKFKMSNPSFLDVLYAVESLRKFIVEALENDFYKISTLQRVCKNSCWQAMIDGVTNKKNLTALDFAECPARKKTKTAHQLRLWLENRIIPARICRVDFGSVNEIFSPEFCAVVAECCRNVEFVKFSFDGSKFPLKWQLVLFERLRSLDVSIMNAKISQSREKSLENCWSELQLPSNLRSLTLRDFNNSAAGNWGVEPAYSQQVLLYRNMDNLKYVHADVEEGFFNFAIL